MIFTSLQAKLILPLKKKKKDWAMFCVKIPIFIISLDFFFFFNKHIYVEMITDLNSFSLLFSNPNIFPPKMNATSETPIYARCIFLGPGTGNWWVRTGLVATRQDPRCHHEPHPCFSQGTWRGTKAPRLLMESPFPRGPSALTLSWPSGSQCQA